MTDTFSAAKPAHAGVLFDKKRQTWRAASGRADDDGNNKSLGSFANEDDAGRAYGASLGPAVAMGWISVAEAIVATNRQSLSQYNSTQLTSTPTTPVSAEPCAVCAQSREGEGELATGGSAALVGQTRVVSSDAAAAAAALRVLHPPPQHTVRVEILGARSIASLPDDPEHEATQSYVTLSLESMMDTANCTTRRSSSGAATLVNDAPSGGSPRRLRGIAEQRTSTKLGATPTWNALFDFVPAAAAPQNEGEAEEERSERSSCCERESMPRQLILRVALFAVHVDGDQEIGVCRIDLPTKSSSSPRCIAGWVPLLCRKSSRRSQRRMFHDAAQAHNEVCAAYARRHKKPVGAMVELHIEQTNVRTRASRNVSPGVAFAVNDSTKLKSVAVTLENSAPAPIALTQRSIASAVANAVRAYDSTQSESVVTLEAPASAPIALRHTKIAQKVKPEHWKQKLMKARLSKQLKVSAERESAAATLLAERDAEICRLRVAVVNATATSEELAKEGLETVHSPLKMGVLVACLKDKEAAAAAARGEAAAEAEAAEERKAYWLKIRNDGLALFAPSTTTTLPGTATAESPPRTSVLLGLGDGDGDDTTVFLKQLRHDCADAARFGALTFTTTSPMEKEGEEQETDDQVSLCNAYDRSVEVDAKIEIERLAATIESLKLKLWTKDVEAETLRERESTATALLAAEIREAATLRVEITDRENEARLKETEMNELWEAMRSELEGSMRREEDALAAFETYKSETLDNGAAENGRKERGRSLAEEAEDADEE